MQCEDAKQDSDRILISSVRILAKNAISGAVLTEQKLIVIPPLYHISYLQVYIPSSLIVVMSWVSFWLNRGAAPARVGLGVTTVLTMTTLINSVNAALPKISYMKSIDIYLFVCFFMVFGAMVEYACVGYTDKRIQLRKNRFEAMRKLMEEKRLEVAKQMELQLVENREPLLGPSSFNGKSNGYRTPRAGRHHREVGEYFGLLRIVIRVSFLLMEKLQNINLYLKTNLFEKCELK